MAKEEISYYEQILHLQLYFQMLQACQNEFAYMCDIYKYFS